ncbi:MAG: hypothetical protein WCO79_03505, partial [bacterium]
MLNKYSKKVVSGVISFSILFSGVAVFAQGGSVTGAGSATGESSMKPQPALDPQHVEMKKEVREARTETRKEVGEMRKEKREDIKAMRGEMRKEIRDMHKNASSTMSSTTRREEFKKDSEMKREETKKMVEEKHAQFAEKVKTIKDEKKKVSVEKLNENLIKINADSIAHFTEVLNKQDSIALEISSRISKVESGGASTTVSVSTVKTDLALAHAAIVAARASVVAQTARVYS